MCRLPQVGRESEHAFHHQFLNLEDIVLSKRNGHFAKFSKHLYYERKFVFHRGSDARECRFRCKFCEMFAPIQSVATFQFLAIDRWNNFLQKNSNGRRHLSGFRILSHNKVQFWVADLPNYSFVEMIWGKREMPKTIPLDIDRRDSRRAKCYKEPYYHAG